ncbi:unnamed protein product [Camellia sinensis]
MKKEEEGKGKEGKNIPGRPKFKKLENGRFKCVEIGHEVPSHTRDSYAQSKRCWIGLIDAALAHNKPPLNTFHQDHLVRSELICTLTGNIVNKSEEHINGKRFLNMLEGNEQKKKRMKADSDISRPTPSVRNDLDALASLKGEQNEFEVFDEEPGDDEEGGGQRMYKLPWSHIIPFPKRNDPSGARDFPTGKQVLAVYPSATALYKATVVQPRKRRADDYVLEFDDDEEKDGSLLQRIVPFHRVVGLPEGHCQTKILDEALAGANDGLLLRGVQKVDRTTNVTGRMASIMNDEDEESKIVMPGDRVKMVVELIMLVACEQGMRFAIREGGKTLDAGVIQSIVE